MASGMTPGVSLDALLADPTRAAEIPSEQVSALLGELERLRATLWARLVTTPSAPASAEGPESNRLLTADEVAARLGVPKSYVYELARRRTPNALPTVAFGKYVRFAAEDVAAWVAQHRRGAVDTPLSTVYSPPHDGRRGTTAPAEARPYASATRGAGRRALEHGRSVGARRGADHGANGPATSAPSRRVEAPDAKA